MSPRRFGVLPVAAQDAERLGGARGGVLAPAASARRRGSRTAPGAGRAGQTTASVAAALRLRLRGRRGGRRGRDRSGRVGRGRVGEGRRGGKGGDREAGAAPHVRRKPRMRRKPRPAMTKQHELRKSGRLRLRPNGFAKPSHDSRGLGWTPSSAGSPQPFRPSLPEPERAPPRAFRFLQFASEGLQFLSARTSGKFKPFPKVAKNFRESGLIKGLWANLAEK